MDKVCVYCGEVKPRTFQFFEKDICAACSWDIFEHDLSLEERTKRWTRRSNGYVYYVLDNRKALAISPNSQYLYYPELEERRKE